MAQKRKLGGDDLDDGLEYAYDSDVSDGALVIESDDEPSARKSELDKNQAERKQKEKEKAKAKSGGKEKQAQKKRQRMENEMAVKTMLAKLEPAVVADYMAKRARVRYPKLSTIELADRYLVPQTALVDLSAWQGSRDLAEIEVYLDKLGLANTLKTAPEDKGSPYVIVLSLSALRACEVRRALPKEIKSMKSIAKNSVDKDKQYLEAKNPSIVLTTPFRVAALVKNGSLKLTNLKYVIVESSHLDSKMRTVLDDVPETLEVLKMLVDGAEGVKVALF
ncbi:U3-containing 90S pre-ribosomal complex subunit-domain containing protein [Dipodascopsis tothii]|uniref:U3-containing 90S pre-ribosomal complex subunit-domain containing protein n=1 Tax=Dipodascopsis tothii TaxID=44089 RepID=UPI0034CEEE44